MLKLDLPRLDLATNRNAAKSAHLALQLGDAVGLARWTTRIHA